MSSGQWTTEDEIKFIEGLGTWIWGIATPTHKLLRNYITANEKRTDWGEVDSYKVLIRAMQILINKRRMVQ